MPRVEIHVRDGVSLTGIRSTDKAALLEHLHAKDVYRTTLNIPHPYTPADADSWIQKRIAHTARVGQEVSFAIRETQGNLVGVVSADNLELGNTHKAEIGYWLAKPYWGQGIMTDAVREFVRYAFDRLQLHRLTAHVFESNVGSARVLEKNGFVLEGRLRKHLRKDDQLLDVRFYGLLKEDVPGHER